MKTRNEIQVTGKTFRWHDSCHVLKARGLIHDFSKSECLGRARKMPDEDIAAGRVVQTKFGHPIAEYELI
jgi:hypothetical protein